ncbi:MAG: hypothetical protein NC118_03445 [Eubacterium sp.]|nr:hypothetical protein [Eubacterium sp.]
MKYYIIETDKKNPLPDISGIFSQIPIRYLTLEYEHKLEDYYVLEMKTGDETLLPDIFTSPFLMVKRDIFKVIMMYMPEIKIKYMSLVDSEKKQCETYVVPILDIVEGKTIEETDFSKKMLFYVSGVSERFVVARLDLLESILRRNAIGLKIQEFSGIKRR